LPKREFIVRTNTRLIINTIKEGNLKVWGSFGLTDKKKKKIKEL
jgi:hypothetical protein